MRIISGTHGGIRLQAPANLPVRPTTDLAKSALFNILHQRLDFSEIKVLDLFAGTGNISFEFASRGTTYIKSIDKHPACIAYIKNISEKYQFGIQTLKADVFKYIAQEKEQYDVIFADPPYNLPNIPDIAKLVFAHNLLKPGALLIIEHASMQKLDTLDHFMETRVYGSSTFSFFSNSK